MPKRPRETYRESYRKGAALVRESLIPERFPFTPAGWRVDAIELMAAGSLDDGREFQEVRIYTREIGSASMTPERK